MLSSQVKKKFQVGWGCFFKNFIIIFLLLLFFFFCRIMDILSGVISISLISWWWLSGQVFYLSNFITVCIVGSFMKLLKFQSFKDVTIFLTFVFITDGFWAMMLHFMDSRSYNSVVISDFNTPVLFQIPGIPQKLFQRCVWMSFTNILFPGLVLGYTFRYDKSYQNQNNVKLFSSVCMLSYFIGMGVWVIVCLFIPHSIPASVVAFPFMVIFTYMFAYFRRESDEFWNGQFLDIDKKEIFLK